MGRRSLIVTAVPERSIVCRLCAQNAKHKVNILISNKIYDIIVEEAIQDLIGLKVGVGDGLPSTVCQQCVRKLIEFKEFKEQCFESDVKLRACSLADEFNKNVNDAGNDRSAADDKAFGEEEYIRIGFCRGDVPELVLKTSDCGDQSIKQEVEELDGDEGEERSSEKVVLNPIQVTEVYIPMPDQYITGNMVPCHNNIRVTHEETLKKFGNLRTEGKEIWRRKVLNDSCDTVSERNIHSDCSTVQSFVINSHSKRMIRKNNRVKLTTLNKNSSQLNDEVKSDQSERSDLCHRETNPSFDTYTCDYCNEGYSEMNLLAVHIKGHMDEEKSAVSVSLKENVRSRLSPNPRVINDRCVRVEILESCGKAVRKNVECMLKKVCGKKSIKFKEFGRELKRRRELDSRAVIQKTDEMAYECDSCGETFSRKSDLAKHLRVHAALQPFERDFSVEFFDGKEDFTLHGACHVGVKQFGGATHKKVVSDRENQSTRREIAHPGSKPHQCAVCGTSFVRECNLRKHSKIHVDGIQFACKVCGKAFNRRTNLRQHELTHSASKPFQCELCPKKFSLKESLKRHEVTHTGLRRFECGTCAKRFIKKSDLSRHAVVHTGEKAFTCEICNKAFNQRSSLRTHLVIHSGETPFECKECGKKFSQIGYLKRHVITHTELETT